jgi:hypothetical protein
MVNGWQLALRAEKQAVLIDEAAWVSLSALNGTGASSQVERQKSPWMMAEFQIQRIDGGGLIPLRPLKDKFEKLWRAGMGMSISSVPPGGITKLGRANLRTLFDLGPGTYHVQGLWHDPYREQSKKPNVISNQITISIIAH